MVLAFFFLGGLLTTGVSSSFSQEAARSIGVRSCRLLGYDFLWICSVLFILIFFLSLCLSPAGVFFTHNSGVSLFFGVGVYELGYVRYSSWCVVLH
ncbi:hypothetical protein RHGRI_016738 [Rhododendron griersonianum]|uniref:Uncharacterized protein n=1 Tax=Rhododendron griersonianum TaxID=479676 RepID=A0AAV6JV86_9ERIC|nr:hypothetical protein RHGRI_016738 [Rhododendron griersonianum]